MRVFVGTSSVLFPSGSSIYNCCKASSSASGVTRSLEAIACKRAMGFLRPFSSRERNKSTVIIRINAGFEFESGPLGDIGRGRKDVQRKDASIHMPVQTTPIADPEARMQTAHPVATHQRLYSADSCVRNSLLVAMYTWSPLTTSSKK